MIETTKSRRPIVVGVDGSEESAAALSWAADQAIRTGAPLEAVIAWDFPVSYGWSPLGLPGAVDLQKVAESELSKIVIRVLGEHPEVPVTETVVEGPPTHILVHYSSDAELLVVGCRGRGALRGMLLGSVSSYVYSHAHCPVVIVHGHDEWDEHPLATSATR